VRRPRPSPVKAIPTTNRHRRQALTAFPRVRSSEAFERRPPHSGPTANAGPASETLPDFRPFASPPVNDSNRPPNRTIGERNVCQGCHIRTSGPTRFAPNSLNCLDFPSFVGEIGSKGDARRRYCGRGGRAFAIATRRPQEMRSAEQSSRSMTHSISVGPSRLASATSIAAASSPPLVTRMPRPRPSSALKAWISPA
jgi:hypothetical protein